MIRLVDLRFKKKLTNNFWLTDIGHPQTSLYEAYDHIKTILFFIGYARSRHTLLGSLLDAHPHIVVADEAYAFTKWSSNPPKWMNNSVYLYYDLMFKASQRDEKGGRRSRVPKRSVAQARGRYFYRVPNQWQGRFDRYIEVSRMWGIYRALKSEKDPIGILCIRVLWILSQTDKKNYD